jgi:hypothetical protein
MPSQPESIAFSNGRCIAAGALSDVAFKTKQMRDRGEADAVWVFDAQGRVIEIDWRGTASEVSARAAFPSQPLTADETSRGRRPGRPKLGVVAREITLLPRHWEWLNDQPGGASVALRKLVEVARRSNDDGDQVRRSQENAYRFMHAIAGNEAGFEEASRALFVSDKVRFDEATAPWPADVRDYARALAEAAFSSR